uniref:Uncharacterized protein n=1 Tax=Amphimedon queenslandica TaxID=400682 RepID=A0A1X7UAN6_AMPQE
MLNKELNKTGNWKQVKQRNKKFVEILYCYVGYSQNMRLIQEEFMMDPSISEQLQKQLADKLHLVRREMAWESKKHSVTLTKLQKNVSNAMIIAAIHPLEYCRMFSYNTPDGPSLLQTLSLSSFHKILVSLNLMKLCVSTKTHHIIAVNLTIYFIMFSSHYSKNFSQKSTKRVPPTQRLQDPPISQEDELER